MTKTSSCSKHVPERTCIACRQKKPKWELVRIVRTPEGSVEVDNRGKRTGRGTYLCKRQECWETGLNKKKLERALKSEIAEAQLAELVEYCRTLPAAAEDTESSK